MKTRAHVGADSITSTRTNPDHQILVVSPFPDGYEARCAELHRLDLPELEAAEMLTREFPEADPLHLPYRILKWETSP